ncbi:MAG: GTPase Era [Bacteroidota bacterium]|nr:GTPase Era [Bacteroidota bacterium]MDP4226577.1 GTPase Era [Bacteroidota bacterium]MDP4274128.1 GTPase Era [Bacteroidota bacterium]
MTHKSGFVNIIGNPNVGKSTIMNNFVGEKLSIITSKAQTTRHRIMGIVNGEDYQIVYSDTPGILKPSYKLQETMMKFVGSAFVDADLIIYVTDVVEQVGKNHEYIEKLKSTEVPVFLLINKIDLSSQPAVEKLVENWKEMLPKATIYPVSALTDFNLDVVKNAIIDALPEGPAYYPKDAMTDRSERFFVTEIIREKILLNYRQEIPYSVEVAVESFKEEEDIIKISSIIYVMRESQKGIIIGNKGAALKKVGTEARKDIEAFFGKKVFLKMFVKVSKDWRDDERSLQRFGYNPAE